MSQQLLFLPSRLYHSNFCTLGSRPLALLVLFKYRLLRRAGLILRKGSLTFTETRMSSSIVELYLTQTRPSRVVKRQTLHRSRLELTLKRHMDVAHLLAHWATRTIIIRRPKRPRRQSLSDCHHPHQKSSSKWRR